MQPPKQSNYKMKNYINATISFETKELYKSFLIECNDLSREDEIDLLVKDLGEDNSGRYLVEICPGFARDAYGKDWANVIKETFKGIS